MGTVRNLYNPSVFSIGYLGVGSYKTKLEGKNTKVYTTWKNMFDRCYNKKTLNINTTYVGCSVDKRWHNFQVFAEWFEENYIEGWELDKDILVKGNKVYSPETCCFIPKEVNSFFTKCNTTRGEYPVGVVKSNNKFRARIGANRKSLGTFNTPEEAFNAYRVAKKEGAKILAKKYKNKLLEKCYQAITNYKIEIND